jgi:hypothetical protein
VNINLAYLGNSNLSSRQGLLTLQLQPNLQREPVGFDARLTAPLRFREGISALHDIAISDLKYKPKDRTAYKEWLKREKERMNELRRGESEHVKSELNESRIEIPGEMERQYQRVLKRYWKARRQYSRYVRKHDPKIWRLIMPYDPVITVADDVLFFECFSADESSYGCLTVSRDEGFGKSEVLQHGTTNVDYSWDLYNHFQRLRSYRETRFQIDPTGFEVKTDGGQDYREEKIDLPESWLHGFMQIQAAMGMPMRKVPLSRDALYSLLAWLKRRRPRTGPRAIRFDMIPGENPRLTLEPWEMSIVSFGTRYEGPGGEAIRIWGRRRLLVLARLLPLVQRIDVYLLGTGLPSFWVVHMGEMRLTLGLSGWTANDWTRGSALDLLSPPAVPMPGAIENAAEFLKSERAADFESVNRRVGYGPDMAATVLNRLARSGQAIYDLGAGLYRYRQILPMVVDDSEVESYNPELTASRELAVKGRVRVDGREDAPSNQQLIKGDVDGKPVEVLMDLDGRIRRANCGCKHHRKYGIRRGPCRHVMALRNVALQRESESATKTGDWYNRMRAWAYN